MSPSMHVWSTDLHAAPIGCQIDMFAGLDVEVMAKIDFPNCRFFRDSKGNNLCSKDLDGLRNNDWRGFSLDPDPETTTKRLHDHYAADESFRKTDVIFCSHPAANCEIYLPTNKSIIIYSTTRLEFGRDDEHVWWRKKYMGVDKTERWQKWVSNLKQIASSGNNFVLANNLYDASYIEYFTGIRAGYIPSWCGGTLQQLAQIRYTPSREEFVLTPYRLNLMYDAEAIPLYGWPEPGNTSHTDDLSHAIFDDLRQVSGNHLKILTISEAFGKNKKFEDIGDFRRFKGSIFIPYQSSTMFFFELYRACVPILAPSMSLLTKWVESHRVLWEVSYGDPPKLSEKASTMPSPNRFDAVSRRHWMPHYDIYNAEVFPHILHFDSWQEAATIAKNINMKTVSDAMCAHNSLEYLRIEARWKEVFDTIRSHKSY